MEETFKSGFVALVGRPNVGKSSLFNRLVGEDLAICTPKAQTTRLQQRGIVNAPGVQVILLDTPGLSQKFPGQQKQLQEALRSESVQAVKDAEVVFFILDSSRRLQADDEFLMEVIARERSDGSSNSPAFLPGVFLVVNKVDLKKRTLFDDPAFHEFLKKFQFAREFKVSAKSARGLDVLMEAVVGVLPQGQAFYPADIISDASDRVISGEMVRESVFLNLQQELPYATFVEVGAFKDEPEILRIVAIIYIERESQKKIVVGSKGEMIKRIGTAARKRLESHYQKKVFLDLSVKVAKDWTQDEKQLKRLGFKVGK